MVDAPPAKNFIVVITFLAIWSILLATMPAELVDGSGTYRTPTIPENYWSLDSIEDIATSTTINMSDGGGYFQDDWGIDEGFGHNFLLKGNVVSGQVKIENQHYFLWVFDIPYGHHSMSWISKVTGEKYDDYLTQDEFDEVSALDSETNMTYAAFTIQCEHVTLHNVVSYNQSLYNNATEAFENDSLYLEFGIEWDELGTGLNAWNLLTSILFFQSPDIHPYINALIAAPLWAAIAYLGYLLAMVAISVLPFT